MKKQLVKYAVLNDNGVYTLSTQCTVFTNDDVIIITFETEQERDAYIVDNEIVIE